jgi:hypothetical protein
VPEEENGDGDNDDGEVDGGVVFDVGEEGMDEDEDDDCGPAALDCETMLLEIAPIVISEIAIVITTKTDNAKGFLPTDMRSFSFSFFVLSGSSCLASLSPPSLMCLSI